MKHGRGLRAVLVGMGVCALIATYAAVTVAAPSNARTRFAASPAAPAQPATRGLPPATAIRDIVGLGDSVPAGSACSCTTYISLVASNLAAAEHTPVKVDNLSSPGQTAATLIDQLRRHDVAAALADADAVILTVGANDLESDANCDVDASLQCYTPNLRELRTAYGQVLTQLRALSPERTRIIVTGYWDVFLDGAVARQKGGSYLHNSDVLTRAVNAIISSTATAQVATYVDVYKAFRGDGDRDDTNLLAADGDHPNAAGHRVIAQAINTALLTT